MKVSDIKNEIQRISNWWLDDSKITSLIHRVKVKENANELLFKGIEKMLWVRDEEDAKNLKEIKDYCFEIDFTEMSKSKHGGRGADKTPRNQYGSVKRSKERKEKARMDYWNDQQNIVAGGSWIDPPNM